jgi:hypothetical protein
MELLLTMNAAETTPNGTSEYGYAFLHFSHYNKLLERIKMYQNILSNGLNLRNY